METLLLNNQPAKWTLTAASFERLLSCLQENDRQTAGEKYIRLRHDLVRFFEGRGFAEAEEAADEVLNRLARKLETEGNLTDLRQYAYGIARMLVFEIRRSQITRQKILNEIGRQPSDSEPEAEPDVRLDCLNQSLSELSGENRELILTYYQGSAGSEKIELRRLLAEKLGIPPNALQNRAVRLRNKLKGLIQKKLTKEKYSDRFLPISSVINRD